jgi:hypothetical protein
MREIAQVAARGCHDDHGTVHPIASFKLFQGDANESMTSEQREEGIVRNVERAGRSKKVVSADVAQEHVAARMKSAGVDEVKLEQAFAHVCRIGERHAKSVERAQWFNARLPRARAQLVGEPKGPRIRCAGSMQMLSKIYRTHLEGLVFEASESAESGERGLQGEQRLTSKLGRKRFAPVVPDRGIARCPALHPGSEALVGRL